jgi:PAS domain-containing protein
MGMASPESAGSWSVKRFILEQNIDQLQRFITEEDVAEDNIWERITLAASRRQLARLDSAMFGVHASRGRFGHPFSHGDVSCKDIRLFHRMVEEAPRPYLIIDPRPGLRIVDLNDSYAQATLSRRGSVAGQKLFDAYPDNPDDPDADGVGNLYASLLAAANSARPHAMPVQRYDVRDAQGNFVQRYWRPRNTPIYDENGKLLFLLHEADDVTDVLTAKPESAVPEN